MKNGYCVISCLRMDITGRMMIVESRDFIYGKSLIYPPHSFKYLRCIPLFSILRYFYFLKLIDKNMISSFGKPAKIGYSSLLLSCNFLHFFLNCSCCIFLCDFCISCICFYPHYAFKCHNGYMRSSTCEIKDV